MSERNNRFRKTEKTLRNLFLMELKNKHLEKVSVTELCRKAELDRSTFYLHYADVFALVNEIEKSELADIRSRAEKLRDKDTSGEIIVKNILVYLRERQDTFTILMKEGSTEFWDEVRSELQSLFKDKVLQQYDKAALLSEKELQDIIVFLTNGFYGIYRQWLKSNLTDDLDYISELSTRLSTACFKELLAGKQKMANS